MKTDNKKKEITNSLLESIASVLTEKERFSPQWDRITKLSLALGEVIKINNSLDFSSLDPKAKTIKNKIKDHIEGIDKLLNQYYQIVKDNEG